MKKFTLIFLLGLISSVSGWAQCSDIFFSEYIEGSSNNKALEIFNPTGNSIDLEDYEIHRFNNGASIDPDTFELSGMLASAEVYVVVNAGADSAILAQKDTSGSATFYNGNDALVLLNTATGDTVDIIGVVGEDPGSSDWPVGTGATGEFTLVRMASVNEGTTDWALGATQWMVFPQNTFDSLGAHSFMPCGMGPSGTNCTTDIFFSEYIEGSGNNKALEIFNPMDVAVDLDDYEILRFNNGASADPDTFELSGMLASTEVYIVGNSFADSTILAEKDTTGSATFYNGNDALVLLNTATGDTVDIIGVVGEDPGSSDWPVGTGATGEFTLVRMANVNEGTTDWALGATQWMVFPQNTFDSLGSHTMNPCTGGPPSSGTNCTTDIFFSEYIEGSSNNKALEIFNPMDAAVDLENYEIHRFNNGASADPDTFELSGMLASAEVYIVVNAGADSAILAQKDTSGSATFYNGNDALVLLNTATGDTVDIIGVVGEDPGSSDWPVGTGATGEFTLVRMASVNEGTTDWALGATQWMVFPQNTFDSLGAHTMNPCQVGPPTTNCTTEIFFSEYIEGSSNNKALEIFNPMDAAVDLENYEIHRFNNGASADPDTFELSGMLASAEVYIVVNAGADPLILAEKDTSGSASFYNGNDALVLLNTATGDTVDIIGVVGEDPGSSDWPVGTGATGEFTLVRMASVNEGTTDWALSSTQWMVFPQNTFDSLGSHTMNPCGPPAADPTVTFVPNLATANELDGTVSFSIAIMDPNMMPTSVSVELDAAASTATLGADFTWSDSIITFPAGSGTSISLDVTILDDAITEQNETIVVNLVNPTNNAVIGNGVFTLTIEDDEFPIYPIGLITDDADGDGIGDSLNVRCEIQGIVHGVDLQGTASTNLLFTVIDSTGGIAVFSGSDTSYTVLEGDEVIIRGSISHFNGLTQFSGPDTIILLSQGNPTVTPLVVTALDETTESELVTLECVTMVDTSQWPTGGGSANVDVTNGVDTFTVRIDGDVDVSGTPVPNAKYLNITGIGGQFDASDPRTEGYQLLPRYMADVVLLNPEVGFTEATAAFAETNDTAMVYLEFNKGNPEDIVGLIVLIDSAASTATPGVDFTFSDSVINVSGCGDKLFALPLGIVNDTDPEADETIVLYLTSVANATVTIDTITITITGQVGIKDLLPASAIKLYPNPGRVNIRWESDLRIKQMTISNLLGQEIVRKANPDGFGQMNISTLPKGLYIIRMKTDKGIWTKKWMKE